LPLIFKVRIQDNDLPELGEFFHNLLEPILSPRTIHLTDVDPLTVQMVYHLKQSTMPMTSRTVASLIIYKNVELICINIYPCRCQFAIDEEKLRYPIAI
jgi:hypothetical protein